MKPFSFMGELPPAFLDIPGVWANKNNPGGRVPLNAHSILDLSIQDPKVSDKELAQALSHSSLLPGLDTFVKEYQKHAVKKALALSGSHCWAPPGAGKTLIALIVAANKPGPRLVVTKAAARGTWVDQTREYTNLEPVLLLGQKPDVSNLIHPDSCLFITAWETLKFWRKELVDLAPGIIVYDEIHWLRRPKYSSVTVMPDGGLRFEGLGNALDAARAISAASNRHLGLTATPIPGRVKDLWTQLDLCEPWQWGSFHDFGMRYCGGQHNGYGYEYKGLTNSDELRERLSYIKTRISREQVNLFLPPKRREIVRLDISQQSKPSAMKRQIKKAAKSGDRDSYFEALLMEAASRKHGYIEDRVLTSMRSKQKVVVFTGRRLDCERLGEKLTALLAAQVPEAKVWWAHGGTDSFERDSIRHEYMASPGPTLLVGTGDAWGESINLQDTDLALIAMLPWTPDKVIQWEGRFSRLGQKRPVLVTYVIARATADEHVADLLLDKLPHVGEVAEDNAALEIENALGGVEQGQEAMEELLSRVSSFLIP